MVSVYSEDANNKSELLENHGPHKKIKFWKTPLFRQMFVASGPIAIMLCCGMALGTATVMIPQIKANTNSIQLTQDEESWLYSMHGYSSTPAVLTIPYLSQVKGYKFVFILMSSSFILSCILQYLSTIAIHLLIAAALQGVTMGGNVALGVIILTEFPDPKYRGTFLVFKSATFFWGIWISNAIGTFFSWRNIPLIEVWPAIFTFISCFVWPESPYLLASQNKMRECEQAFRWLRGYGRDAEKELSQLTTPRSVQRKSKNKWTFFKTTVLLRQFYLPFFLTIALFFLYQACGKFVCQTYILVIIKEITKTDAAAYTGMLILDGVTIFGMYLGSYVAAKVKRRTMLLSTSACTIFFLYLFSAYLYLIQLNVIKENYVVSLGLLILYSFSVSWGPMVLCTSIFSEITPMRFKTFVTSITVCFMFIMQSSFLKLAPIFITNLGMHGTFAVYGTLIVFPVLFLYRYLPETKNRTLTEIESLFAKENLHDTNSELEGQEMLSYSENKDSITYFVFYFTLCFISLKILNSYKTQSDA